MAFLRKSVDDSGAQASGRVSPALSRRNSSFVKFSFSAVAAMGLVVVNMIGPYSAFSVQSQAYDVIPLSKSDRLYQTYAVGDTLVAVSESISAQSFEVVKLPEPEPEPKPEPELGSKEKGTGQAPPQGTPDPGSAKAIALSYVGPGAEYDCLVALWNKESGWNHLAQNKSSGAYGIPQSLPGSKMASAGADWQTNPDTQIRWGLGYIQGRYGSPCGAWAKSQSSGWY
ncbi:transglycosylase SLT domain-containing protein [Lysinibacter sp. HNR]|uniref:aggregation-promoting factor C-terminal-like domain-containing protein n=1 Tax=Lysinibacter sp. HNR TaxID=3031408 RepID=UPI002435C040|nr:transglycosylase SLT domain-containing protein [Lysinibacter sp. HNR]WGD38430.1 transglycosylase SLT domain-containing protein [Lysinibacter sp. HNR]